MKDIYHCKMLMMVKVILLLNHRIYMKVKKQLKNMFLKNNLTLFLVQDKSSQ